MSTKEPTPGPYESTTTKVIELSNIKFSVTETVKSTHVPPAPCGCDDGGLGLLMPLIGQATAALSKPYPAPEPFVNAAPPDGPTKE